MSCTQKIVSPFVHIFYIVSLFAAEFEEPKIGISGKGLNLLCQINQTDCVFVSTVHLTRSKEWFYAAI